MREGMRLELDHQTGGVCHEDAASPSQYGAVARGGGCGVFPCLARSVIEALERRGPTGRTVGRIAGLHPPRRCGRRPMNLPSRARLWLWEDSMRIRYTLLAPTLVAAVFAGAIAAVGAAVANTPSAPGPGEPTLAEVRDATERFRDVNVALAEGYIRDPFNLCDTAAMMGRPASLGAMGIHYFRPDLLGITAPPSPRVTAWHAH